MKSMFVRFVREDAGQDLIEYALLAGFISLACYVMIDNIGNGINTIYTKINTAVTDAGK